LTKQVSAIFIALPPFGCKRKNIWMLRPYHIKYFNVRFQVLTAESMKFRTVFWDVLPCKIIVYIHPWWWRQHVPLKRRSTIVLHGSTSQNTILNIIELSRKTQNTVEKMSGDKDHKGSKHDNIATYKAKCKDCPQYYAGQTARTFSARYKVHKKQQRQHTIPSTRAGYRTHTGS
jgi:hypothetical protein